VRPASAAGTLHSYEEINTVELSRGSKAFLVVLLLLVAGGFAALRWAGAQLDSEADGPTVAVTFEVELGVSRSALAEGLEAAGVVKRAQSFDLYSRELFVTLEAGTYELTTNMAAEDVEAVFRAGPARATELTFRVEEGLSQVLTLERLAEQFDEVTQGDLEAVLAAHLDAGGVGDDALLLPDGLPDPSIFGPQVRYPFEGLLFPETYNVAADANAEAVLQRMVDQLAAQLKQISADELAALDDRGLTVFDAMVIASLVERETRVDAEREIVASVIYNRLDVGMPLQLDATVLYALGQWKERVLYEDTTVDSPYNTYAVTGLPPTPISGFGAASLRAALNPASTTFTYYVLTPACDGAHVFAKSLSEHNRNVAAFRSASNCL
jgi:UPF0755 protein